MHEHMEVVFLGTGASWPTAKRNVAATAIKRGSEILLLDCGEGTQRQFQRSKLSYMQVTSIWISHLHADHFLGIPGLVQTMGLNERTEPLRIYGPPGTERLLQGLLRIGQRRRRFPVPVKELADGDVVDLDGYEVNARQVKHKDVTALAYALQEDARPGRFDKARALELGVPEGPLFGRLQRGEPVTTPEGREVTPDEVLGPPRRGRKVAYSGDCEPCEAMAELAQGADLLVHEATYASDFPDANGYGHSTAAQAAYIAKAADVGTLVLTHVSPRYTDVGPLEEEARKVFPDSHVASDLDAVLVRFPGDDETTDET